MARKQKYKSNAERQKAYRERKAREKRNAEALQNKAIPIKLSRPALQYHGGKFRLASWIIKQFPSHDCYVEPFGGGGSVLLAKPPAVHEVFNDLNSDVVNFFHVLREYSDKLIRLIDLTPYSREEHQKAWESTTDPLERARRFYVRIWQSYGSGTTDTHTRAGWKFTKSATRKKNSPSNVVSWKNTDHLWDIASRLKFVHIEHDDALKVIKRWDTPGTLFYLDPPYVLDTRSDAWAGNAYAYEMNDDEHVKLSEAIKSLDGMAIISGYDSPLYRELYSDWHIVSRSARDKTSKMQNEILWVSPRTYDAQLPMFQAE